MWTRTPMRYRAEAAIITALMAGRAVTVRDIAGQLGVREELVRVAIRGSPVLALPRPYRRHKSSSIRWADKSDADRLRLTDGSTINRSNLSGARLEVAARGFKEGELQQPVWAALRPGQRGLGGALLGRALGWWAVSGLAPPLGPRG